MVRPQWVKRLDEHPTLRFTLPVLFENLQSIFISRALRQRIPLSRQH